MKTDLSMAIITLTITSLRRLEAQTQPSMFLQLACKSLRPFPKVISEGMN